MSIPVPMLQRQLKMNAQVIRGLEEELTSLKFHRKMYYQLGQPEQAVVYSPFIRKFKAKLVGLRALQGALKVEIKNVCYQEWLDARLLEWEEF